VAALPEPYKSLRAAIERMQGQIRELYNRSPFFGTGMHANGSGGIDSDNFVAGTSGYSFKSNGNAEFNDLTLRGGIIGNDALTDPVSGDIDAGGSTTNFAVSTTSSAKHSSTIPVPAGFTQALVMCSASVTANNNTASFDYMTVQAAVNGVGGGSISIPVNPGEFNGTTVTRTSLLTGLSGGTISVQAFAGTTVGNWAAHSSNIANVNALAIFTR
jgi:hypothetical protein